jgi:hypothetical protein
MEKRYLPVRNMRTLLKGDENDPEQRDMNRSLAFIAPDGKRIYSMSDKSEYNAKDCHFINAKFDSPSEKIFSEMKNIHVREVKSEDIKRVFYSEDRGKSYQEFFKDLDIETLNNEYITMEGAERLNGIMENISKEKIMLLKDRRLCASVRNLEDLFQK